MKILSIETSCDDTCASVIELKASKLDFEADFKLLSNIISSQVKLHAQYGGVFPTLARREHQKNIICVVKKALNKAGLLKKRSVERKIKDKIIEKIFEKEPVLKKNSEKFFSKYKKPRIDYIAATIGPGLEPCLWMGVNFAKAFSYFYNIPVIATNHIESHFMANIIADKRLENIEFPAIALVVSGGNTQLILVKKFKKYELIGETKDDAAGECMDKTARILGLGYPGGPQISKKADLDFSNQRLKLNMPRPMMYSKNYDFSFSGLKTAVLYDFKKRSSKTKKSENYIRAMSFQIQQSIIDVLAHKTFKAASKYKAKTILLGGGVSANQQLRKQFKEKAKEKGLILRVPKKQFSTDNAAMVAAASLLYPDKAISYNKLNPDSNLKLNER